MTGSRNIHIRRIFRLGNSKIEHFDEIAFANHSTNENIRRFNIAMNDAALMGFVDALEDLSNDINRSQGRHFLFAHEDLIERIALDMFHDDIHVIVVHAGIDELDRIGMDEVFDDLHFEQKSLYDARIALRSESFERNDAIDADLAGAVDDPIATSSNLRKDFISPADDASHGEFG